MSEELILSLELYIMIIMFQMLFILPKLIVQYDINKYHKVGIAKNLFSSKYK